MTWLSGLRAVVTGGGSGLGLTTARRTTPASPAAPAARQPIGRLVSADEAAAALCYPAGPDAASSAGTGHAVDGGKHGPCRRR
jgi:NAD(P)-dependent dehydrogenase (short-subunit alcohol dehydrogenase family)